MIDFIIPDNWRIIKRKFMTEKNGIEERYLSQHQKYLDYVFFKGKPYWADAYDHDMQGWPIFNEYDGALNWIACKLDEGVDVTKKENRDG